MDQMNFLSRQKCLNMRKLEKLEGMKNAQRREFPFKPKINPNSHINVGFEERQANYRLRSEGRKKEYKIIKIKAT